MLLEQLVLLLVSPLLLVAPILALRTGDFSMGQELLLAVEGGLCLYLLVYLHLKRTRCRWAGRLERIASTLGQIFTTLLCLLIAILDSIWTHRIVKVLLIVTHKRGALMELA